MLISEKIKALNTEDLLFEEKALHKPSLDELETVLHSALIKNFEYAVVSITSCPNLQLPEFGGLQATGLCGCPTLLELGGAPYLLPVVKKEKVYNIKEICQKCMGDTEIFAVGAGAGPFHLHNTCCEGIYNFKIKTNGEIQNGSYTARINNTLEECVLETVPGKEYTCPLLLNLFLSYGQPGMVLKIICKKRIGPLNFIECIRSGLKDKYEDKCVGMGGLFLLKNGKIHQHVMRDFSQTPIYTLTELNTWLKFFEMPSTMYALGTLVTHENDLDLRLQHFHSFSKTNWGGHYHYDTTPDTVEYEAYLNVADRVIRVDKPLVTHKFGRD